MPIDTLVVIQQVATAIDNQALAIDFQALDMVRGVAMHQVHAGFVDQAMGEALLLRRHGKAPVAAPVQRDQHPVAGLLERPNMLGGALHAARREVVEARDSGAPLAGRPIRRYPTIAGGVGEYQQAPVVGQRHYRRGLGAGTVQAGAGMPQAVAIEAGQGLAQAGFAPVQHMIVGQHAAVDAGHFEYRQIGRMHPVVDAFGRRPAVAGHGGFQIDQAHIRPALPERLQRHAPDIGEIHRPGDRAVAPFGQAHIVAGILDISLIQARIAGVGQDLVDAPGAHQVTREKQSRRYGIARHTGLRFRELVSA
ncbi:hypothetical protein D3C85_816870 [compost metagenome]